MSNSFIKINNVSKKFGRRTIFKNVTFSFDDVHPTGISGHNGAGKSTLLKIIAGVLSKSSGEVNFSINGERISQEKVFEQIGFVAPYLILYGEFSPIENLAFFSKIRGVDFNQERANDLLKRFGIYKRRNDYLKGFSSGMLQRMKFVFALYFEPEFILLDEPTSNLDDEGKQTVYKTIEELTSTKTIIIASNEKSDLELCNNILELEKFK